MYPCTLPDAEVKRRALRHVQVNKPGWAGRLTIEDVLAYYRHQHTNYRQLLDRLGERQGQRLTRNEHHVIKQRVDQLVGMRYPLPWV